MQHIIFTKPLASGQPGAGKCIWYLPATYFTANKVAMSTAQHTSGGAHDTVDFLKHEKDQLSPKHGNKKTGVNCPSSVQSNVFAAQRTVK